MSETELNLWYEDMAESEIYELAETSSDAVVLNLLEDIKCLKEWLEEARADQPRPAVPEGYVLVPRAVIAMAINQIERLKRTPQPGEVVFANTAEKALADVLAAQQPEGGDDETV